MAVPAGPQRDATRVLLVGKSAVTISILEAILSVAEGFRVVAVKRTVPEDVTSLLKRIRPDVVLVDVPEVDDFCLEVISAFARSGSVPVVAVAPPPDKEEAKKKLVPLGALGVISRPRSSSEGLYRFAARLGHLLRTGGYREGREQAARVPIVAIASSAGGPSTLRYLLERLPLDMPAAIVVIQHINQVFFDSFVRWLEGVTAWDLIVAGSGEVLATGKVYLMPPTVDLGVDADGCFYEKRLEPTKKGGVRPSVDNVLKALSVHHAANTIAVILTGIGDDGTAGAKELREAGGYVIAESEKDSLVFGMPRSVIEAGAADEVLSLSQMPERLVVLVNRIHAKLRLEHREG